jgi:threonine synthase
MADCFIPALSSWLKGPLSQCPKDELAFRVMRPYIGGTIPDEILYNIAAETVNFPFPLVQVTGDIYSLELFHGPTLAFKDVGARFMSRCLGYFNQGNPKKLTVLVATSGDTGGAVANGFENVEGVEVIILYPSGKVSPVQELQLTTCAANIYALEIKGSFDDCQAMVKKAFADDDLKLSYQLTSANSINVARWLPQQLYYFFALQQWPHAAAPVISVPSGNFGNICAGMVAQRSGLPVAHFIAACNANDVVPQYLEKGIMYEKKAVATISNAMDVALPSNFVRIMEMYDQDLAWLKTMLSGCSVSDDLTRQTIDEVYRQNHYTLDPHGAVGYYALRQYLDRHPGSKGIFLETAHPVKFPEVVEAVTGQTIGVPGHVQALFQNQKRSTLLDASYDILKDWLMAR